jgi:membrane-associated phospholipid phosphatase
MSIWAWKRKPPARTSDRVRALGNLGDIPSYPSEHAAVAAAAHAVLSALFPPADSVQLNKLLRSSLAAPVVAGAAFPSDIEAGRALGSAIARAVLQRAATDGADRPWSGVIPTADWAWKPTPVRFVAVPFDAGAGNWTTWVIPRGDAFRPSPFPALGTPRFQQNLDELRRLAAGGRTVSQMDRARFWATEAPTARWELFVDDELSHRGWSLPRTARARAWVSVAMYDAFVACWDAKFHYWLARPVTIDRSLNTVFSTPPFPSYPSGHSTISTAAAVVMSNLFPDKARLWDERAIEASNSRVWAGVHYRFDIEAGDTLGTKVGTAVVERMKRDGVR